MNDDELEFRPAELLGLYGQAGAFIEARIARPGHEHSQHERELSDLLVFGIAAAVKECGPRPAAEAEPDSGAMGKAGTA